MRSGSVALRLIVLACLAFVVPLIFEIKSSGLRYLAIVAFIAAYVLVAEWALLPAALDRVDQLKRKGSVR